MRCAQQERKCKRQSRLSRAFVHRTSPPGGGRSACAEPAFRGRRPVFFAEARGYVETPTFDRARLKSANRIEGPALVEEYASTTTIHPGDKLEVDGFGNLVIAIGRK